MDRVFKVHFDDFSAHAGICNALFFIVSILVSLDNIQDQLENPFDEVGEDDIVIEAEETSMLLS